MSLHKLRTVKWQQTVTDELEGLWKETVKAVMPYFNMLFQYLCGGTGQENYENKLWVEIWKQHLTNNEAVVFTTIPWCSVWLRLDWQRN